MSPFDITVIVVISLAVLAVIGARLYRRFVKKDKSCGCGCGCKNCGMCKKQDK